MILGTLAALAAQPPAADAQSTYFGTYCAPCHGASPTTCNGCHHHGPRSLVATTDNTTYAPGQTVTVTVNGGRTTGATVAGGWVRAILYLNNVEIARSTGPTGEGGGASFPIQFKVAAPAAAGSYTYQAAWFGNSYDTGNANPDSHGEVRVSAAPITVAAGDTTPPTVNSTNPANNATGVAVNASVTATFSEPVAAATVTNSTFTLKAGAATVAGTASASGATVTFAPSAALAYSTTYTATLTTGITDAAGNALAANYSWSFTTGAAPDTTPPTVSSTNPANSATGVAVNVKPSATFSEAVNASTVTTSTFTLSAGGSPVAGTVSVTGATAVFTPSAALPYSTVCTATLTTGVKDLAGNAMAANYSWSFTTGAAPDTTPPSVASTSPVNGATAVDVATNVDATFNEAIDPASVSAANFTLKAGAATVAGAITVSGSKATLNPTSNLAYATTYTASIGPGVKDLAGNATASATTWTFTTATAPDTTPPTVSSTSPSSGATGVTVNSQVTATVSEPVAATTVNASSFTLKAGAVPVAGTVSTNGATVTFTPSAALAYSTTYTGTLAATITDLAGNALGTAYSWSFTTGTAADTTPPTITATSPKDGATGVPVTTAVTATFSEALDASTVTTTTFGLKDASNNPVAGSVAYVGFTATFSPTAPLAAGAAYTATVTTGVKDVAGNALAAPFTWSFTTASAAGDRDGDGCSDVEDDYPDDARRATPRVAKGNGKILIDISSNPAGLLREVTAVSDSDPALNQTGKPNGREFVAGLVSYKVVDIPVGSTVRVKLTYPFKLDADAKVYTVGPDGFHELAGAQIDGKTVTVALVDGGKGDRDGIANGVIVDPIGVATPVASSSSSGGGCSVAGTPGAAGALPGAFALLPVAALWLVRRWRRSGGRR